MVTHVLSNNVFLKNLSPLVSDQAVRDFLLPALRQAGTGEDEILKIVFKLFPGSTQKYCQLDFKTSNGVTAATSLNGQTLLGVPIVTSVIEPVTAPSSFPPPIIPPILPQSFFQPPAPGSVPSMSPQTDIQLAAMQAAALAVTRGPTGVPSLPVPPFTNPFSLSGVQKESEAQVILRTVQVDNVPERWDINYLASHLSSLTRQIFTSEMIITDKKMVEAFQDLKRIGLLELKTVQMAEIMKQLPAQVLLAEGRTMELSTARATVTPRDPDNVSFEPPPTAPVPVAYQQLTKLKLAEKLARVRAMADKLTQSGLTSDVPKIDKSPLPTNSGSQVMNYGRPRIQRSISPRRRRSPPRRYRSPLRGDLRRYGRSPPRRSSGSLLRNRRASTPERLSVTEKESIRRSRSIKRSRSRTSHLSRKGSSDLKGSPPTKQRLSSKAEISPPRSSSPLPSSVPKQLSSKSPSFTRSKNRSVSKRRSPIKRRRSPSSASYSPCHKRRGSPIRQSPLRSSRRDYRRQSPNSVRPNHHRSPQRRDLRYYSYPSPHHRSPRRFERRRSPMHGRMRHPDRHESPDRRRSVHDRTPSPPKHHGRNMNTESKREELPLKDDRKRRNVSVRRDESQKSASPKRRNINRSSPESAEQKLSTATQLASDKNGLTATVRPDRRADGKRGMMYADREEERQRYIRQYGTSPDDGTESKRRARDNTDNSDKSVVNVHRRHSRSNDANNGEEASKISIQDSTLSRESSSPSPTVDQRLRELKEELRRTLKRSGSSKSIRA